MGDVMSGPGWNRDAGGNQGSEDTARRQSFARERLRSPGGDSPADGPPADGETGLAGAPLTEVPGSQHVPESSVPGDGAATQEAPTVTRPRDEARRPQLGVTATAQFGRTPADPTPLPDFDAEDPDWTTPELYLNRELTWLNFNFRVLHEADDPRTPLLERVKFLSIVSSNLDEFFMKRIGGLKQQVGARVQSLTVDGRTPEEQIEACYEIIRLMEGRKRQVLRRLLADLAEHDIRLATFDTVSEEDQAFLREHYLDNVYPLVTPQSTDPAHPFPFVSNLSLNLLVTLRYGSEMAPRLARVKVPVGVGVPRFLKLPNRNTFVTLESVMAHNLELLFPGVEIIGCELFRVTRNANTEQEEEAAEDLVGLIEVELRERKLAPIVRLETEGGMNPVHRGMLAAELGLDESSDVFEVKGLLGPRDLMQLLEVEDPSLRDPAFHPFDHASLTTARSVFHVIREEGSILVHHPYQSFNSSVERFLEEASGDPKVRAIKMTFYRTSEDSKAIRYLMDAARNGKQVAVVMELKARFDEEANLRWANRLGSMGIHVTYGVMGLKTHCKVILVVRQDYDGLRRYAHIGTGNYHAGTARLYGDVGLMTCDPGIGGDLTEVFNYLTTGYKPKRDYRKVKAAPKGLKKAILDRITREMEHQEAGAEGHIQIKMNALEDSEVTRALYEASRAGVKVDLIVRDTCRLRPGIPGLSENVTVLSIVGRYLEHARVYYFRNAGDEEYWIGSADCMQRNLQSRVEVMAPVEKPRLQEQLRHLLDTQLGDRRRAWEMQSDGSYVQRFPADPDEEVDSQESFMAWAESEHHQATRLKRRQVRGLQEGNLPR
jgi:polyphosphate kinase